MAKRARKDGSSLISTNSKQKAVKRTRKGKNVGKLAMLLKMPMDILFEILAHLRPLDLLHVARTSKELRRILLAPSSTSVWKDSLSADLDLPECPPDLSYPGWAHLVYDPFCHMCSDSRVKNPDWKLRVRLCALCSKRGLSACQPWSVYFRDLPIQELLPHHDVKDNRSIYVKADIDKMVKTWKSIKDTAARWQFSEERRDIVERIDEHASRCEAWARKKALDKIAYQDTVRLARRTSIIQKLKDAGYTADIESMTEDDWASFDRLRPVAQKRALTDQAWKNMKENVVEFIMSCRDKQPADAN